MDAAATDETLMLRYRDGDAQAFDELYARHKGGLYRYLLRQCATEETAQELFQDVWMKLINARERYEVKAKFTTYLYRIAHNRLVDHYRRQRPELALDTQDPDNPGEEMLAGDPIHEPHNGIEAQELAARLIEAIKTLPELQREVFLLHEEAGLSIEQIAHVTGANAEATKSRFRYAIKKLRTQLSTLR